MKRPVTALLERSEGSLKARLDRAINKAKDTPNPTGGWGSSKPVPGESEYQQAQQVAARRRRKLALKRGEKQLAKDFGKQQQTRAYYARVTKLKEAISELGTILEVQIGAGAIDVKSVLAKQAKDTQAKRISQAVKAVKAPKPAAASRGSGGASGTADLWKPESYLTLSNLIEGDLPPVSGEISPASHEKHSETTGEYPGMKPRRSVKPGKH